MAMFSILMDKFYGILLNNLIDLPLIISVYIFDSKSKAAIISFCLELTTISPITFLNSKYPTKSTSYHNSWDRKTMDKYW